MVYIYAEWCWLVEVTEKFVNGGACGMGGMRMAQQGKYCFQPLVFA